MIRVRLPAGANYLLVDPDSHLVVMHRSKIVDMCDALVALLERAQKAEGAAPATPKRGRR